MEVFSFRTCLKPDGGEEFNITLPMGKANTEVEARALFAKVIVDVEQPPDAIRFELIRQKDGGTEEILATQLAPARAPS